ncbi:regulator [Marinitoga sp. 1197]|uniref:LytR/AlgR family response regulator transcription factor n=1 Tax=Marinitoga sp. 1197 TaxID=1428449 RepID=UPI000640E5B5|nr:LytTR family DNA-binding domain-containing protein [Marinitoga sp. 1197]KLO22801.1 regulator [Marinitoga sp. 1197]
MIKCIIIEDEERSLNRLKKMLENFESIEIIGESKNGDEAIDLIEEKRPDLLFLDINLPEKSGFEILKNLSYEPLVIFITAYQEYAIKAFEENAIDYLLKPFDLKRLKIAIDRITERKKLLTKKILDNINIQYINKFSVKDRDIILIIPETDVYYFKAEDKYVFLCTKNQEYYYDDTLKNLEMKLDPEKFIRIHKSYIVSIEHIKKFKKFFVRDYILELDNGTELKIGRSHLNYIKNKFNF